MATIYTIREKCRPCYSCVRSCPANAIKIEKGRVITIEERCILCGSCVKICPQRARTHRTGLPQVLDFLRDGHRTIACLDPSFPAILDQGTPRQLVTALKRLGFHEVWEAAFGAELVCQAYGDLIGNRSGPIISSFCAAVVSYIEKFASELIPKLAPLVSPMVATGRMIKEEYDPDAKVVFIGPCLARIGEMRDPQAAGVVDQVLTFHEIKQLLDESGIDRETQVESEFDGPKPNLARMTAVSGGMLKGIGMEFDILNDQISVTCGRPRSMRAIHQLQEESVSLHFLDVLYCEGCIDGPYRDRDISIVGGRQIVALFTKGEIERWGPDITKRNSKRYASVDLGRHFTGQDLTLPLPSEDDVREVLQRINKREPDHNLDCQACGYRTCREKAIAVLQGLAEVEMCLPYLLEQSKKIYTKLETSHRELQQAHQQLEQAHLQLIRTEKLASIGQLAAGVAHEINNPLGTITIFSHMLMKSMAEDDPRRADLKMIIDETSRTKEIVKGLLSFARETVLKPGMAKMNVIIDEVLSLIANQSLFFNVTVNRDLDSMLPDMFLDAAQLKQVFLNIILNGAQAMDGSGMLTVRTRLLPDGQTVQISFSDTGPGISQETMGRLFDPFFTTKEKGTGLGLAIAYGIVDRHGGTIDVRSQPGQGATFIITLPVLVEGDKRIIYAISGKDSPVLIGGL